MDGTSPLAGLRVLELRGAGGAFAGRLLAMLGADVVTAGASPRPASWFSDAGKRAVNPPETASLARAADVVIGGAATAAAHPRLVTCSISPFGDHGPYAAWHASELVLQAMGGMLGASGERCGPPLVAPGPQAHLQAGIFGAIGILAALLVRERSGRGQHVEVSMQAAVAASLEHVLARFLHDGTPTERTGRLHWTRCFRLGLTRDGWAAYTTLGDWTTLVEWLRACGMAEDLDDPAYADAAVRQRRAEHVFDVIEAWGRRFDADFLAAEAQLRRLAFAAVHPPEALLRDPQLAARRFFVPTVHPASGRRIEFPGPPFRLGPLPARFARLPNPDDDPAAVVREWLSGPEPGPLRSGGDPPDLRPPLTGIRVADFTWLVAGPTATRILADLGADVIKVEHPKTRDAGDRRAGFTGTLNRGKRSAVLDLATAEGRAGALRLALSADVVIDNFSARVMEQCGLDPTTLRAAKPVLICVRMTGFGTTGPDRDQVSFGPTLQARAGYTALMADAGGAPIGFGFSYADVASGHLAALAVLAALWRRGRTGEGATIDFAQLEAAAALLGGVLLERTAGVAAQVPAAPDGVYPCKGTDRWIAITVQADDEWRRLTGAIGEPAWTREARFATASERVRHRAALDDLVASWTREQDADEVMTSLQRAGIAAGRVATAVDLCERDPQLAAWGFFVTASTPEGESVRMAGPPFHLSESRIAVAGPGPLLGEHTAMVLQELASEPLSGARTAR